MSIKEDYSQTSVNFLEYYGIEKWLLKTINMLMNVIAEVTSEEVFSRNEETGWTITVSPPEEGWNEPEEEQVDE